MTQGLSILRRQTKMFINERPEEIVFTRTVKTDDGAGGKTSTLTTLPPQVVRIVEQGDATDVRDAIGAAEEPALKIVGMHDLDVQDGDRFRRRDRDYKVRYVRDNRDYITHAVVDNG